MSGSRSNRCPVALKQRAVRIYDEVRADHNTDWEAMGKVSELLGIGQETLRRWVRQAEIDHAACLGTTPGESAEIKQLRRENTELKRTIEILKAASVFFAAQLDRAGK